MEIILKRSSLLTDIKNNSHFRELNLNYFKIRQTGFNHESKRVTKEVTNPELVEVAGCYTCTADVL